MTQLPWKKQTEVNKQCEVCVLRKNGSSGVVGCKFQTKDGSAMAGKDYEVLLQTSFGREWQLLKCEGKRLRYRNSVSGFSGCERQQKDYCIHYRVSREETPARSATNFEKLVSVCS